MDHVCHTETFLKKKTKKNIYMCMCVREKKREKKCESFSMIFL